ncbi:MAG TPA: FxLYD domain-containing protein [Herpetosiphonaceae bacterium]|nr:FxLYD domain-containing protein [Herpetosiphonaceae bacterium]
MYPKRLSKPSLILALLLVTLSSILAVGISRASSHQRAVFLPVINAQRGAPPPATSTPPPTAEGEVVARGFVNTSYYDFGSYHAFGEVINNLDVPVFNVELTLTYRNASGEIVMMDTGAPALPLIEARSSSPFYKPLLGSNVPQDITQFSVEVTSWETQNWVDFRPITILSTNARIGDSTVVEGEARNTTEKVLWSVFVAISFRNSAGEVVWVAWESVAPSLQPGQTMRYTYESFIPGLTGTTARVQGYGRGVR